MTPTGDSIIDAYARDAETLIPRYEAVLPELRLRGLLHLFPNTPSRILDIGAGTGRVADWLVDRGHSVTAVEPVAAFRAAAAARRPKSRVSWLNDRLPGLNGVTGAYDFILAAAVLYHFDKLERTVSLSRMVTLMAPNARLLLSLRHGPGTAAGASFDCAPAEMVQTLTRFGLGLTEMQVAPSHLAANRAASVTWTWLCFARASAA